MFDTGPWSALVEEFRGRLAAVPEGITAVKLSADRWSLREIVGHLIDSASNNHQRFVRLQGVNSVTVPYAARLSAWERVVSDLPRDKLEAMTTVVPLADVPAWAEKIVAGQVRGRVVIDVNA